MVSKYHSNFVREGAIAIDTREVLEVEVQQAIASVAAAKIEMQKAMLESKAMRSVTPMTSLREQVLKEIAEIPEANLPEVLDFLQSRKFKHISPEKLEISLLSESVLAKDWLTPEEDEAWKDL